jgi:hypothetical protein
MRCVRWSGPILPCGSRRSDAVAVHSHPPPPLTPAGEWAPVFSPSSSLNRSAPVVGYTCAEHPWWHRELVGYVSRGWAEGYTSGLLRAR